MLPCCSFSIKYLFPPAVLSTVTLITERRNSQPYGINGGNKGMRGINNIIKNNTAIKLPPKISLQVKKNEIVKIETPGGGAWGKPIKKI